MDRVDQGESMVSAPKAESPKVNLLIISDLHLGDDLKPGLGFLRHVVKLERELESFLSHYTNVRLPGGQPWRLVINGDMVDFLGVCLLPTEAELAEGEHTPVELEYGVGSHPRAARAKMQKVLTRHEGVFRALARFVAAGNFLDIVVGNHDAEFHWPVVQDTFRGGVAALVDEGDRDAVRRAIAFHPWFYFEEDVAWVEHGHQYDAYCSFDYVLHPADDKGYGLVPVVSASLQRYVSNQSGYVEGQELWSSPADYIKWGLSLGTRGLARLTRGFYLASAEAIAVWRRLRRPERAADRHGAHRRRLKELADQFRVSEETLLAVHALRREPVSSNLWRVLGALMLDKLLLVAGTMFLALVSLAALPWTWSLGLVSATVAGSTALSRRLSQTREPVDASPAIYRVSQELARRVKARFFVFGHTHDPKAVPLEGGGWLYNTGTWMPAGAQAAHAFTHLMIRHEHDGPRAMLCQWRDGESRELGR
jgi:UDP-2,3-diacylglucosamine pyrophosphatase LpxH